ncbi:MAG: hypothetical protein AAGD07_06670 [Planctomycetota bacterium]
MSRNRTKLDLGHDAFLDIVANLVGILIILVVVLGAQSQPSPESEPEPVPEEKVEVASSDQLDRLGQLAMRSASAQRDSHRLEATIASYDERLKHEKRKRDRLLDLLSVAQSAWEEKQRDLDEQRVAAARLQTQLAQSESELASLAGRRDELNEVEPDLVRLTHLPTPMAKTVFGDEIYLRLKGNQLSVVPVDPLIESIKGNLRAIANSRNRRDAGVAGPIRGYIAHYAMDKQLARVRQGGGVATGVRMTLAGIVFEPVEEPHGQPLEQVMSGGNFLDIELAGRDPGSTTITVWVYPDSFAGFRALREHLYQRGFATAARPLPEGQPIAGSPNGSRSSAQ